MKNRTLSGISFQQIEVFLEAAKWESLTRAAEELHMTQSTVSRTISGMEEALGLVLFVRYKQRLRLTEGGQKLAEGWKGVLESAEQSVDQAFRLQQNRRNLLSLGDDSFSTVPFCYLETVGELKRLCPEVETRVLRDQAGQLLGELRRGRADAAFLLGCGEKPTREEGVGALRLCEMPLFLITAQNARSEGEIAPEELASLTAMIVSPSREADAAYRRMISAAAGGGSFRRLLPAENVETLLLNVEQGNVVTVAPACFGYGRALSYSPIRECTAQAHISLYYRKDSDNPYLHRFLELCESFRENCQRRADELTERVMEK